MYTLTTMASLQARITKGIKYYSIVESYRDENGTPKNRILQYLGTADNILDMLSNGTIIKSYSHGLISQLLQVAQELDLVNIINNNVSNQKIKNGLTIGASFLLSACSRVSGDYSKQGWSSWNSQVSLETILKKDFSKLNSDHFWQQMNCVTEKEIEKIQIQLFKKAITLNNCNPKTLLLDATNFFTYIDTTNNKCEIAKRGRNKQKRNDLRQVATVLLVTKDELLPVFHTPYNGNINDVSMFKEQIENIIRNVKEILPESSLELIFDKGNLSKDNLEIVDQSGYKYTTSIPRTWVKSIIKNYSSQIAKGEIVDCSEKLWGEKRRFIIYRSKKLLKGQLGELRHNINKIKTLIKEVNLKKEKENNKSREDKILDALEKYKYTKDIFCLDITEEKLVSYQLNFKKIKEIIRIQFGINILTTNNHKLTTQEVIKNYQSQHGVESVFRVMKNQVSFRPFYHWTDSKIKIHILICLISYILITSLHLKAKKNNCNYSIKELINKLESVRLSLCSSKTKKFTFKLEDIQDVELQELVDALAISSKKIKQKISGFSVYN